MVGSAVMFNFISWFSCAVDQVHVHCFPGAWG